MEHIPLMLNLRVDNFFNIVDFFGYAEGDTSIVQSGLLQIATHIIDSAKKYSAYPLEEKRIDLQGKSKHLGISFSLIFKNRELLDNFLDSSNF